MKNLGRRDFHKLSLAALGGALAGAAMTGCATNGDKDVKADSPLMSEPHVCRGLNTCKGVGSGGENDCAGMGACATAGHHSCKGANDCKGQGGCHGTAGMNECKGNGGCGVPLSDKAWKGARSGFESAMKAAGKTVGDAPAKG